MFTCKLHWLLTTIMATGNIDLWSESSIGLGLAIKFCHTLLISMSKLNNAIGANSVTCRVLECDVLQNKCFYWPNVMFTGNIDIPLLRFFKMWLHYLTVCKNIPAWKYKKKILSILVCRQNIWHFQTIAIFLMRIWWLVQLQCKNSTERLLTEIVDKQTVDDVRGTGVMCTKMGE